MGPWAAELLGSSCWVAALPTGPERLARRERLLRRPGLAAVHRSADEREPWAPEQALTPSEALRSSTDGVSSLAVGGPGDLVLVDAHPVSAERATTAEQAARLRGTRVLATVVAGRLTYSA